MADDEGDPSEDDSTASEVEAPGEEPEGSGDTGDTTDTADSGDTGEATDTAGPEDTGDAGDSGDSGDTGEATDTADPGDSGDSTDSADSADSADSGDSSGAEDTGATTHGAESSEPGDTTDTGETSGAGTAGGNEATTDSSAPTTDASQPDPGPPYLFLDQYSGDFGPHPPWDKVVATPHFAGVILKAWQGLGFNDGGWFTNNWPAVKTAGGERYAESWFRGSYLYLVFVLDGARQAAAYLAAIDKAGGWDSGDIVPIVDVEYGQAGAPNTKATTQQIVDCVSACNEKLHEQTGKRVMLYGRTVLADRHITDHLGFDLVWNPTWGPHMSSEGIESWDLEDTALWQYCGDGVGSLPGYPLKVDGFHKVDLSVFVKGAQRPTLDLVRDTLL